MLRETSKSTRCSVSKDFRSPSGKRLAFELWFDSHIYHVLLNSRSTPTIHTFRSWWLCWLEVVIVEPPCAQLAVSWEYGRHSRSTFRRASGLRTPSAAEACCVVRHKSRRGSELFVLSRARVPVGTCRKSSEATISRIVLTSAGVSCCGDVFGQESESSRSQSSMVQAWNRP